MKLTKFPLGASLILAGLLVGCAPQGNDGSALATSAAAAFQRGNYASARTLVRAAIRERDSVSDYWVLLARIDVATGDQVDAFEAYRNAIVLDQANLEALRGLCQLGLNLGSAADAEQYADQLLLLNPKDALPTVTKGAAALERGNKATANALADQVLATAPGDINALILKSRIALLEQRYSEAAGPLESSLAAGGDPASRLTALVSIYSRSSNREGFENSIRRLAQAQPNDTNAQIQFADMLYEMGRSDEARQVVWRLMRRQPEDLGLARSITNLWLNQGQDSLRFDTIVADTRGLSIEMRAAHAQFANAFQRPDLALAILGPKIADAPYSTQNLDAKSAYADALALERRTAEASTIVAAILRSDPSQPSALIVKSRLSAAAGDRGAAVTYARRVISDDPQNTTARIQIADTLFRGGDEVLGTSALREGVEANPRDVRLVDRLANHLIERGDGRGAESILRDLARAAPVSLRAQSLRKQLCLRIATPTCMDR